MKLALIGYGKMGHAVEAQAHARGHAIVKIDPAAKDADFKEISAESVEGIDVCVDFTSASNALENATKVSALKKNLVIGTTGWYDKMQEMQKIIANAGNGCIWSGNFSIGMNVFFKVVKQTAGIMNSLPEYDAAVYEIHHNQKKDSPGGSAKIIGNLILENMPRKTKIIEDRFTERKPTPEELHVASVRCGNIPGTHTVLFDCSVDTIELKHIARGREGFAFGAVLAAEFIAEKKGFYNIDDLMKQIIEKK